MPFTTHAGSGGFGRRTMLTRTVAAALTGLGLFAAAACGGSDDTSGSGDAGSGGSDAPISMKIGYASASDAYQELYVQADYGIFDKHGIEAELSLMSSSSQLVPALVSGSVDVANGSGNNIAAAILKGADLIIIGLDETHYPLKIWTQPDINSLQELRGKKVGLTNPGSETDHALTDLLEANGMKRDDVESVFLASGAAEVAAMKSGAVSAVLLSPNTGTALMNGDFNNIGDLTDLPAPTHAWAATADYVRDNPEAIRRFVASENEGLQYIRTNPEETTKAIMKYTKQRDEKAADYARQENLKVKEEKLVLAEDLIQEAFQEAVDDGDGATMPDDIKKYMYDALPA